ncbi:orotidine-5'-phosphate decarboxylase [Salinisphaera sp. P385]|uniref:Orotidine 5'-phosphate decarboxylase n=1 Tax=Spectribacter acetivorans TaxID=3075603 RepID=A0ABU3BB43_9GAMM|nr:orotidine-5'-phosphate decarboxylase [Salinisphaera sp. P385]MDT0619673.1 orotidine-5'-phosphate decarboxylase [Salinisphaera sp. P385]
MFTIPARERLIVALDVPHHIAARQLVEQLDDAVVFYKVGLELALSEGFLDLIDWLRERDKKVFVDLKLFDVPATVGRAIARLAEREVDFATVHGNQAIMEAAAEAKRGPLKILAVTALTSLDRGDLDDLGFACDVESLVLSRARRALAAGCDGVVSSGMEVAALRAEAPDRLIAVTPGIRPVDNDDDQKRVMTPREAIRAGSDYLVVGRPIRDADDPRAAAETIQSEIAGALSKSH